MDSQTAREYFREIVKILEKHNLDWVVAQINEEIRIGKLGKGEFAIVKQSDQDFQTDDTPQQRLFERQSEYRTPRKEQSKKEKFNVLIPYTDEEKLDILINAVRRLLVETSDIEKAVIDFFRQEGNENQYSAEVSFFSEDANEVNLHLSYQEVSKKQDNKSELKKYLDEISAEINHDNSK
jgi:hypothetical protein